MSLKVGIWLLIAICFAASILLSYWQQPIAAVLLATSGCGLIGYSFRSKA